MSHQDKESQSFREAVQLFLRSPQTKLVRHICISVAQDAGYALRNRRSIEQVVHSILSIQGLDPGEVLQGSSVFELIRLVGKRLKVTVVDEEHWTLF